MSKSQTFNSLKTQKYKNELQVQKTCLCEISHHEIVNPGALYCCGEASLNYFIYSWDRWFHRVTIKLRGCDMIVEGWKEEKSYSLFISDMTFFIFLIYSHGILIHHWQLISVHFPIMASINLKKNPSEMHCPDKKSPDSVVAIDVWTCCVTLPEPLFHSLSLMNPGIVILE